MFITDNITNIVQILFLLVFGLASMMFLIWMFSDKIISENKKKSTKENKKETIDPAIINTILEDGSLEKVNNLIDSLIKDAINMYYILNGITGETYLTNDKTVELNRYVFGMVKRNMTPTIKETIGLFYDISSPSKLEEIIQLRIKLHIINVTVQQNRPLE